LAFLVLFYLCRLAADRIVAEFANFDVSLN
jgi:hypothetical protein